MAKDKSRKDDGDQHFGDNPVNYEQTREEKYMPSKKDTVILVFKKNRKKELHIGNIVYTFWGAQRLEVPRSVIEHPDFESQRKEFLIKED